MSVTALWEYRPAIAKLARFPGRCIPGNARYENDYTPIKGSRANSRNFFRALSGRNVSPRLTAFEIRKQVWESPFDKWLGPQAANWVQTRLVRLTENYTRKRNA